MNVSFNRLAEQELIAAARYLDVEGGFGSAFLDSQLRFKPENTLL